VRIQAEPYLLLILELNFTFPVLAFADFSKYQVNDTWNCNAVRLFMRMADLCLGPVVRILPSPYSTP